jgi:hypothetical protein
MPASDFRQLSIDCEVNRGCSTNWELFAEFLEKGVIRRTRMQAVFLPRVNDLQIARDCCQMMSIRPLPLTT